MYGLYTKERTKSGNRYVFEKRQSIYGCNSGLIANRLREIMPEGQKPPYRWHISVPDTLEAWYGPGHTLVVDIKPRSSSFVTVCELLDIWGDTNEKWTPLLWRMRGLLIDEDSDQYDAKDFTISVKDDHEAIYTIGYATGSIADGEIIYKWLPPGPSSTNSALLWPGTLRYFMQCIDEATPEVLSL